MIGYYQALQYSHGALWDADFSTLSLGAVPSLSAYDLVLLRASDGYTVQTSEQSLIASLTGNDIARAGRWLSTDPVSLLIERAATNTLTRSDDLTLGSWSGTTRANVAQANPAGGATSSKVTTTAASDTGSRALWSASFGSTTAASLWYLRGTQGGNGSMRFSVGNVGVVAPNAAGWRRVSLYNPSDVSAFYAWYNGAGFGAAPLGAVGDNAYVYGCQVESASGGHFATSLVNTTGANATRAAERLRKLDSSTVVSGGQFRYYGRVQTYGARTDYVTSIPLFKLDANNTASIATGTGVVTATVGGTTNASSANPPTWAAGDIFEWFLVIGNGVPTFKWRVNAGATQTTTMGVTALPALSMSGAVDLLCDGTTSTFTSLIRQLTAYPSGGKPSWA